MKLSEAQLRLCSQLSETIDNNFGNLTKFCQYHHYKYFSIFRFMRGDSKWDEELFEQLSEQANAPDQIEDQELLLFIKITHKYFDSIEDFCKFAHMKEDEYYELMESGIKSRARFRRWAYRAFIHALIKLEGDRQFKVRHTPNKYLTVDARRAKAVAALKRSREKV